MDNIVQSYRLTYDPKKDSFFFQHKTLTSLDLKSSSPSKVDVKWAERGSSHTSEGFLDAVSQNIERMKSSPSSNYLREYLQGTTLQDLISFMRTAAKPASLIVYYSELDSSSVWGYQEDHTEELKTVRSNARIRAVLKDTDLRCLVQQMGSAGYRPTPLLGRFKSRQVAVKNMNSAMNHVIPESILRRYLPDRIDEIYSEYELLNLKDLGDNFVLHPLTGSDISNFYTDYYTNGMKIDGVHYNGSRVRLGSCLTKPNSPRAKFYADQDAYTLMLLLDKKNKKILSRTLVYTLFNGTKIFDRIYPPRPNTGNNKVTTKLLEELGYECHTDYRRRQDSMFTPDPGCFLPLKPGEHSIPYQDRFGYSYKTMEGTPEFLVVDGRLSKAHCRKLVAEKKSEGGTEPPPDNAVSEDKPPTRVLGDPET